VVDEPYMPELARPSYLFSPQEDLSSFLTRYSLAGGSHHLALSYGHWTTTVEKIAALLGIECAVV
jgi:L-arabinose isomerase